MWEPEVGGEEVAKPTAGAVLQMLSADHLHLVVFFAMERGWRMPRGTFLVLSQHRPAASRCPIDAGTASLPSPKCSEHAICAQALLSRALDGPRRLQPLLDADQPFFPPSCRISGKKL